MPVIWLALIPVIILALTTGSVSPLSGPISSSGYSSISSDHSLNPFPYIPGLGPMKSGPSPSGLMSNDANNTAAIMGQINNVTNPRTYENSAFGISMQYPAVWGAVELKSNPSDNRFPGSSIALFTAPLENATDNFREKALLSIQDFGSAGNASAGNMTLERYTNGSLSSYRNISDYVNILVSSATTFAGQPAHRVVFTEDLQNQTFKRIQVWTVKDNKAYVITFSAQQSRYDDYLPSVESIINSLKINARQASEQYARSAITGITNFSASSNGQGDQNLTFSEDSAGIQMQYPGNWTKVRPGAPLDDRKFAILVSFIPRPIYDNGTPPMANASSLSSVNVGIHDLRPLGVSTPSKNITLEEYTALQSDTIGRQDAKVLDSGNVTLGGLLGHEISYTHGADDDSGKDKKTLQMWALKNDKVYQFIFTANSDAFGQYLPAARSMAKSLQIK